MVSRILMQGAPGAMPSLSVQIDAAINAGNSGGPAFSEIGAGRAVGVASSHLQAASGIGFVIPGATVTHFREAYARAGVFTGIADLGIAVQTLENACLRSQLNVRGGCSLVRLWRSGASWPSDGPS